MPLRIEKPQHRVTIGQPFAIGRYTVTFDEYDRFCLATLRDKPDDKDWGRGRRPVINVSWDDAVAYCAWLFQQTGCTYRLPTEAEWEYAARAGTTTRWSFGNDEQMLREFAWFEGNSDVNIFHFGRKRKSRKTHPVGEKRPNPWGLYDMHGNVREWAEDCWSNHYNGAPTDGSAWAQKTCQARVLRGGSWNYDPRIARAAFRSGNRPEFRGSDFGFRLARTLPP
jgi:formylglycine-generating enzyme required for sulfatase activity